MKNYLFIVLFAFLGLTLLGQNTPIDTLKPDIKLLLTSKQLDIRNKTLFINKDNRPAVVIERKIFLIPTNKENEKIQKIDFPKEINKIDNWFYSQNGNIFIKDGVFIKEYKDSVFIIFMEMPNENFSIYSACDEKNINIVLQENNKWNLFVMNLQTKEITELLSTEKKITGVINANDIIFVSIDKDIYMLENKEPILLHHNETTITSITASDYGLFFSCQIGLYYLSSPFLVFPIFKEYTLKVLCNDNRLYALMADGKFVMINNTNSFEYGLIDYFSNMEYTKIETVPSISQVEPYQIESENISKKDSIITNNTTFEPETPKEVLPQTVTPKTEPENTTQEEFKTTNKSSLEIEALDYVIPIKGLVTFFDKKRTEYAAYMKKWEDKLSSNLVILDVNNKKELQIEEQLNKLIKESIGTTSEINSLKDKLTTQRNQNERNRNQAIGYRTVITNDLHEMAKPQLASMKLQFIQTAEKIQPTTIATAMNNKSNIVFSEKIVDLKTLSYLKPAEELLYWYQNVEHSFYKMIDSYNQKTMKIIKEDNELKEQLVLKNKQKLEYEKNKQIYKNEIKGLKKEISNTEKRQKDLSNQMQKDSKNLSKELKNYNKQMQAALKGKIQNVIKEINYSFQKIN